MNLKDNPSFFDRQMRLEEVASSGQKRLEEAKILVIGAGGLGCTALQSLVLTGIGHITICDHDHVELSNLHRQGLYRKADIGKPKADVAKSVLAQMAPNPTLRSITEAVTLENIEILLGDHDLVLDCCDNAATNYLIHDACHLQKIDLVCAKLYKFEGVVQFFAFSESNKGCLRCGDPEGKMMSTQDSCQIRGILGSVPPIFGSLQAQLTVQRLLGILDLDHGTSFILNTLSLDTIKFTPTFYIDCPLCNQKTKLQDLHFSSEWLVSSLSDDCVLVDLRNPDEIAAKPIAKALHLPYPKWLEEVEPCKLDPDAKTVFFCTKGIRSKRIVQGLRRKGFPNVYSLKDGVESRCT